ncbi:hypothetical protein VHA01S_008_00510 [Vibrio halioticoli NBRC 102217]|uniref:Uncharacterized protein n=1 Tax=Vibrio halioticoli NBRC 102217 TaxID=1219072 RepID=V5HGT8_9VIBR|nr:hypothetical protein [Vibrio halioticoli]GAD88655.1 hypothetical protein VHA01S_008_00510 [Vibrio halioticoli NBRC 102217]
MNRNYLNMGQIVLLLTLALSFSVNARLSAGGETADTSHNPNSHPSAEQLSYIAQDRNNPIATRIDALQQLAQHPSQSALIAVARGLKDPSYEIRVASVSATEPYQFAHRWRLLAPLMNDLVVDVRMTVAHNLVVEYSEMNALQKQQFASVFDEWIARLEQASDEESLISMALAYVHVERYSQARQVYFRLKDQSQHNVEAWIGIAETYRLEHNDFQALNVLQDALNANPQQPQLYYSKALTLVRLDRKPQAAQAMEKAATLAKTNANYWYVNGILHEVFNPMAAQHSLQKAYNISRNPQHLYAVCDLKIRHADVGAKQCVLELKSLAPDEVTSALMRRIDHGDDVITH